MSPYIRVLSVRSAVRTTVRTAVRTTVLATAALLLVGCESLQRTDSLFGIITPYRIDIVQGNVITKEQAERVRPGMTRLQVRDVLGTPLLTDPFHAARWDYVFTIRRPNTDVQARHVVVVFDGDLVQRIDVPELPTEREFVASISRLKDLKVPKLELSEEERLALPKPVQPPAPAAEPQGPVRSFPPLEPPPGPA
jgi:outer membrane protein assembly factor BamE